MTDPSRQKPTARARARRAFIFIKNAKCAKRDRLHLARTLALALAACLVADAASVGRPRADAGSVGHGLRLPAGFEVTEFADSALANDIYTLTVDPKGRIVVAGRGYIRILVDDNSDGRADRAIEFADNPKDGAMGLLWERDTLYVTGDGGLRRFIDKDGDGKADGPSELLRRMKTGGEHAAHAIRCGPDGWLYALCGNNTGIDKSYASLPSSSIKDPIAGCVLRFPPPGKAASAKDAEWPSEIVAHGFRNPYGMDFNLHGELFTYDSDNERCVSLPWYEPTRFYHVIPGGHHGWLSPQRAQFWRLPPEFPDVVAPVCYLGRGSPTGVACYRHVQFPEEYRGGFFLCDWTFGKIHFVKPSAKGASYAGTPKVFVEAVGDNGFAPTGIVVHPQTGDLYVSIGGRGTRGAVYRLRYPAGLRPGIADEVKRLWTLPRVVDWQLAKLRDSLQLAQQGQPLGRLLALDYLFRFADRVPADRLARAILANADASDRYLRHAAARLAQHLDREELDKLAARLKTPRGHLLLALATCRTHPDMAVVDLTLAEDRALSAEERLAAVRVMQVLLGDVGGAAGTVWEGYAPRGPVPEKFVFLADRLKDIFPTGHAPVDREIARAFALLGLSNEAALRKRLVQRLAADGDPTSNLHYVMVLARLPGARDPAERSQVADVLVDLDAQMHKRGLKRDTHWPLRLSEVTAELVRQDAELARALVDHPRFGRPEHALFAQAPGVDRRRAARIFLEKADPGYAWNAEAVKLLGALADEEIRPTLRRLWGEAGLDAAILPLLARQPRPEDRDKFVSGLGSPDLNILRHSLTALEKLPAGQEKSRDSEVLALIRALAQVPEKQTELRTAVVRRLTTVTGQQFGADRQAWTLWFSKVSPELAARLTNPDGVDVAAWAKRLARLDWTRGDAARGRHVFVKASCATCHSGGQALGPDLAGVGNRFSRDDLFTTLLQPSRDVPARYQTTLVETRDGKVYQGIVIYDAVDSLILQTGATTTVRVAGDQVAGRRPTAISLMPAGLLDPLRDEEIVDLYAYLKTLGKTAAE